MSAVLKALLWIIMLPIKLIMLPLTVAGMIQKVIFTILIIVIIVIVVLVIVILS